MSRAVRVILAAALIAVLVPLAGISHAQSNPLKCQRAVLKEMTKFFKAKVKALQKCEEGKAKGKHTDACPCAVGMGCAAGDPGDKAAQAILKAESKLRAGIDKQCGGANNMCEVAGDDNLDYPTLFGMSECPNFENGACAQPIVANDCTGLRECLICIGEAVVDQFVPFLYADFDAAKFGASDATDQAINKCQVAIGKEVTKFALAKEKTVGKCWDARYKGKHSAACPDENADPATAKDAVKAAAKIAKAESKKIAKLCKACGGDDKDCDDAVMVVNPGTPSLGGSEPTPDDILLSDIFASVPDCLSVTAPARPDRGPVDCAQHNPLTTLADLVFCLDCVAEFKVDCLDAARVTDSFGVFAQVAPECNPIATPTPTATPTVTATATATPTATATATPTATPTPPALECGAPGDETCGGTCPNAGFCYADIFGFGCHCTPSECEVRVDLPSCFGSCEVSGGTCGCANGTCFTGQQDCDVLPCPVGQICIPVIFGSICVTGSCTTSGDCGGWACVCDAGNCICQ